MAEYIEREEAIRVLSNPIRKSMCVSIDEYKYRYRQRETDLELIKSLTAADVQPVKWISVYDQLPDYNMVVLVTDGEDVGTGYRYALGETGFMGWAIPFADIEEDDVSHWMPLPEPPKDGET